MTLSLHEITVPCFLQTLGAVEHILKLGHDHCATTSSDPHELVEARLIHDMLPFRFQVQQVVHHSLGALRAVLGGDFRPVAEPPAHDYAGLQALVTETIADLRKITREEIDARAGSDITFTARAFVLHFKAEDFILSFSLPNLHFHATTAYDILRQRGVALGKRDYLGTLRLDPSAQHAAA